MVQGKEGSVTKTRLTVTVDIEINERLEAYCKETLRNKSVVVNKAIQDYLENADKVEGYMAGFVEGMEKEQ